MRRVSWLWKPLAIMGASRLAIYLSIWMGGRAVGLPIGGAVGRWDGSYYLGNAFEGWPDEVFRNGELVGPGFAFYPLFPLMMRFVGWVTPFGPYRCGILVTIACALAVAALLWRLVRDVADEKTADRAVLLFSFFPGSLALTLLYSEGAMLVTAMACLLLLARRQWIWAGVAAALCTASRPSGLVIVLCCGWAALVAIRDGRDWKALTAPMLAPLGSVAYQLWIWKATGQVDTWWRVEHEGWGEKTNLLNIFDRIDYLGDYIDSDLQGWAVIICTVLMIVGMVLLVKDREPTTWLIWAGGISLLAFASALLGMRPRFFLTAFPLFLPYARRLQGSALSSVVGVSGAVLALYTVLVSLTLFFVP